MEFGSIPKFLKKKIKASLYRLSQTQNHQHIFILFRVNHREDLGREKT